MSDFDASDLERVEACELCGEPVRDVRTAISANGFDSVVCSNCGLVFLNPRPREQALGGLYTDTYYAYRVPDRESAKQRIKDECLLDLGGYPHRRRPLWLAASSAMVRAVRGGQTSVVIPYRGDVHGAPRILDIGCGSGDFLLWARKAGWEPDGLDVVETAVLRAREQGLDVFHGTIGQAGYDDNFFDTIHSDNAFEHMHHPLAALRETRRILKPDGLFVICVPNFEGSCAKLLGPYWNLLCVPHHMYQFTTATLTAMLGKAGFVVERVHYKSFFIPYTEKNSFRNLKRAIDTGEIKASQAHFWKVLWKLAVWRRIQVALGLGRPEDHGQFITAYCRKGDRAKEEESK